MNRSVRVAMIVISALAAHCTAHAQAAPTAMRAFQISTFAGASGVYTGLYGGRNLSVTAGLDVGFRTFFSLQPSIEVRGTYPVDSGQTDGQKDVLAGLKVAKNFGRIRPYGDILFGRGSITYIHGELDPSGTIEYLENPTNVFSPGIGVDVGVTENFSLKADAQYQRFSTPVTTSGNLYAKPLTVGIVYRLNFSRSHRSR